MPKTLRTRRCKPPGLNARKSGFVVNLKVVPSSVSFHGPVPKESRGNTTECRSWRLSCVGCRDRLFHALVAHGRFQGPYPLTQDPAFTITVFDTSPARNSIAHPPVRVPTVWSFDRRLGPVSVRCQLVGRCLIRCHARRCGALQ